MKTLRKIAKSYEDLIRLDEITEEELKALDDELENKANAYKVVMDENKAEIEKYAKEIKRLQGIKKTIENNNERLMDNLTYAFKVAQIEKLKTDWYTFGFRKNPPSLKVIREEKIPEEYYKIEKKLNRKELLDDLKEGVMIEGVEIQQMESLQIR